MVRRTRNHAKIAFYAIIALRYDARASASADPTLRIWEGCMSIRVEMFDQQKSGNSLAGIGGILLLLCLITIGGFLSSFSEEKLGWVKPLWLLSLATGIGLIVKGWNSDQKEYRRGDMKFSEHRFANFVGGEVDYIDWQRRKSEKYAIAVDFEKKSFYLYINGLMAHVPLAEIREIGWGFYERGNLIISDLSMVGHKWAFDSAERQRQWDQSGISFCVKDVSHPELKVKMGSEALIRKWVEIWNQMTEGTPPQSAKKQAVAPAEMQA